ncbi:leucine-rich repeat domain-containing protein [Spirosoma sp.]|uniref:leucine-rich repeat domain-containing protein n=1 Tax=Spirosoma sp. TaxID=1899569 RepID=UPI003B3AE27C
MKWCVLLLVFWLMAGRSIAQDWLVMLRDTNRLNVSLGDLEKKYPPAFARQVGQKGVFAQHGNRFMDTMRVRNNRFFSFLDRNKKHLPALGIMLQTQEFVKPDGTFAWVFCEFSGRELTPDQENQLLRLIREWYRQNPFAFTTKEGFRWAGLVTLGNPPAKRMVRKGPGIISTLDAAQKTTRPDTVTMLAFNQLGLTNVPDIVYQFPKLAELDLSKNELHELPARLTSDIPTLKKLSLLQNAIPDDSVFITRNKHLRSLNLQFNRLTRIPESIRQNRRLESLWIGNNKLAELNMTPLRKLRRLSDLNLYNAGLTQLPSTINRLRRVTVLDLYYNKLTELPRNLGKMKRLEQLALSHNDLKELPASLAKLRRLQVLYAHHNRLSKLPATFGRLKNLRILDLGYNWITVVPDVVGLLPSLQELSLNNNNIQEFPTVLLSIQNLDKVYLSGNPLFNREAPSSPYAPHIKQLEANKITVSY